ncbi:MAG: hypothetical protein GY938_18915 [Ketobacter sp.]|nr:hypothetical protein [Planctomycetota bacterium]MCP5017316.1 hypothetical protein [Ketobacter sp.]
MDKHGLVLKRVMSLVEASGLNGEWLEDLHYDVEQGALGGTVLIPLLRGFVRGLYTAGKLDYADLCELDEYIDSLGLALI